MSGYTPDKCAICKRVMKTYVKELECGCQFHIECIDDWFTGTSLCPCCLGFINSDASEPESEEDQPNSEKMDITVVVSAPEQSNAAESKDSPMDLEAIPSDDEGEQCPLCVEPIGTALKELWCGHQFHIGCIDSWMECTSHCPSCMGYV